MERLFIEVERPLFNVVYRWLWHREDEAEVVQEAFLRLWSMQARVDPGTAKPLVYRIALNLAASRRRRARLRRFVGLEQAAPTDERHPEHLLSGRGEAARVRGAVDALPEKLRRVITLCELGELSYADVARALEIPAGTVASRRAAAMVKLRAALAEEVPGDEASADEASADEVSGDEVSGDEAPGEEVSDGR